MITYTKFLMLCFCCGLMVLSTCTRENPIHTSDDGPLEIRPLCKLASSLTIDEIGSAEALVSGKGIDGTLTFELLVNKTDSKLYGTLKLPEGASSCDVVIQIYDLLERKIGEGSYSLTRSHFDAGRCVTPEIGIASAKPRIDTAYARVNPVGINDSIALHAAATDSFGGTIQNEWKFGSSAWIETSTGDTNIIAPSTAQAYVCSLRVTDDDGNTAVDAVTVMVETRAPVAVAGTDTSVGINDTVNLRGSASHDETEIVEFAWKTGDGDWFTVSTGDTTVIAPSTAQAWVCSLRVTDYDGNITNAAITVTVETRAPVAVAGPDTSVGINDAVNLRGSASHDETEIVEFAWKTGDGDWFTVLTGDTTVTAPATAQAWVCSLRVTDDESNITYAAITVTVETRAPVAVAGPDTTVGINDAVNLRGSASHDETEIVEFAWKTGDGDWFTVSTGDTTVTAPSTARAWVCSLRVTDDESNITYAAITVTVETRAPVAVAGPDTSVGINDAVNLRGSASHDETEIVEFAWKTGDGDWFTVSTGDTTVIAPSTDQNWVCSLRVTDDDGNITHDEVAVTVETRAPVAGMMLSVSDTTMFPSQGIISYVNEPITLWASRSGDETSITEFAWKIGAGTWQATAGSMELTPAGDTLLQPPGQWPDTTFNAPATYQMLTCSLRVTDDDGNMAYEGAEITVAYKVTDYDGNDYPAIEIGTQTWTIVNLRTTRYNDSSPIPHVTDGTQWSNLSTPGYCWYNNSTVTTEQEKWGALYNWYAVNTGKLAPDGWHVPTDAEWTTLENYLIANGYNWDGTTSENKIGKALAAKTDWSSSSTAGDVGNDLSSNNSTGFSALPGGYRLSNGNFVHQSGHGNWWSATESAASIAFNRNLGCNRSNLGRNNNDKEYGFSVRLVRD